MHKLLLCVAALVVCAAFSPYSATTVENGHLAADGLCTPIAYKDDQGTLIWGGCPSDACTGANAPCDVTVVNGSTLRCECNTFDSGQCIATVTTPDGERIASWYCVKRVDCTTQCIKAKLGDYAPWETFSLCSCKPAEPMPGGV